MEQLLLSQLPEEFSELFWKRYLDEFITEKDIDMISDWGFNCVRLPLNSRNLFHQKGQVLEFVPFVIDKIDQLIEWCKRKNIYIILDMHGAPGGQTGTNIDDCENNLPELFIDEENRTKLTQMWVMLAIRYAGEPCIAGYDLINEPLPNWFSEYNKEVLPLYKSLAREIRSHDTRHMIILEGVHWATDFSIFDQLLEEMKDDNLMLQFHKYWNTPDKESIQDYLSYQERLQLPLFMGEGGENNREWYYGMFQMLRKVNISYCFWSYKKMDTNNSLISFPSPKQWENMIEVVKSNKEITAKTARDIWEDFLDRLSKVTANAAVADAIQGRAPLVIPAEYYSGFTMKSKRIGGAKIREADPASILFLTDEKLSRIPDYKRYGGEEQPEEEHLFLRLSQEDMVWYEFNSAREQHEVILYCRSSKEQKATICINSKQGSKTQEIVSRVEWAEITCFNEEWMEGEVRISIFAKGDIDIASLRID
jgi:hypothetical protein